MSSEFSGGRSGGGCSWTLCPPCFRSDGVNGAVAALVGFDTAPLSELNYIILDLCHHVGLGLYMYVWGFVS